MVLQQVHILEGGVPLARQNLRRQLAPQRADVALGVVGEDAEVGEVLRGTLVAANVKVELGALVERVEHLGLEVVLLLKVREQRLTAVEEGAAVSRGASRAEMHRQLGA